MEAAFTMNPHQLRRLFKNVSQSVIAANSKDYGPNAPTDPPAIPHPEQRQRAPELDGGNETKARGASCPVVRFTLRRVQLLDVDAKFSSVKDLLDGLCAASLLDGDKEGQVTLEVEQEKVGHYADEETRILITYP